MSVFVPILGIATWRTFDVRPLCNFSYMFHPSLLLTLTPWYAYLYLCIWISKTPIVAWPCVVLRAGYEKDNYPIPSNKCISVTTEVLDGFTGDRFSFTSRYLHVVSFIEVRIRPLEYMLFICR